MVSCIVLAEKQMLAPYGSGCGFRFLATVFLLCLHIDHLARLSIGTGYHRVQAASAAHLHRPVA